jgi:hypothetical protein
MRNSLTAMLVVVALFATISVTPLLGCPYMQGESNPAVAPCCPRTSTTTASHCPLSADTKTCPLLLSSPEAVIVKNSAGQDSIVSVSTQQIVLHSLPQARNISTGSALSADDGTGLHLRLRVLRI